MRFRPGNGMCMMMVSMPMRSLPIATACGGTGDSIIPGAGDGIRLGTIVAGMHGDTRIITIGIMRTIILITTIILIMLGVA